MNGFDSSGGKFQGEPGKDKPGIFKQLKDITDELICEDIQALYSVANFSERVQLQMLRNQKTIIVLLERIWEQN